MSKRLNRTGPNIVWDITGPQGRFMDAQNYKNLCPKVFDFVKILKMRKTDIIYFFNLLIILYCTKRRCVQLEVESAL